MSRLLGSSALICILALGFLARADDDKDKKAAKGKKAPPALEGSWTLTSLDEGGVRQSDDKVKGSTLTMKGDKYTFKTGVDNPNVKGDTEEGTFKVDAGKKPNTIDLEIGSGMDKGKK